MTRVLADGSIQVGILPDLESAPKKAEPLEEPKSEPKAEPKKKSKKK